MVALRYTLKLDSGEIFESYLGHPPFLYLHGAGNVVGMMPHPERCAEALLGNDDGRALFDAVLAS